MYSSRPSMTVQKMVIYDGPFSYVPNMSTTERVIAQSLRTAKLISSSGTNKITYYYLFTYI
jgi:hypothetical protein